MRFEHFALNVTDPVGMAEWYVANLGMQVMRSVEEAPFAHFLADATGRVVIEIYRNPIDDVPDYTDQHPLRFHFAFAVADADSVRDSLLEAGASIYEDNTAEDGSRLIMMRDPWGLPLQVLQRAEPFA